MRQTRPWFALASSNLEAFNQRTLIWALDATEHNVVIKPFA
jgi:hypothetical protein